MAVVKVYGAKASTCTARVLTCFHEKGVDYELVPVNLMAGEHKRPGFLTKNPFGQIPALEDGDLTIFESRAICAYISEKHKGTGYDLLRHNDLKESAQVKVWMEVESQRYSPAIQPIFYQLFVGPRLGQPTNQAIIDQNLPKLEAILDVYEQRLSHNKYLAGEFYSLADLFHLPYTFYFIKTPYASLINDRPHVKAWWADISSRPAFLKLDQINFWPK